VLVARVVQVWALLVRVSATVFALRSVGVRRQLISWFDVN